MSEGFFSRWSRRKQAEAAAQASPEPVRTPTLDLPQASEAVRAPAPRAIATSPDASDAQPLPTLEQAQALTPESDFQPFMQRGVGAQVRNAAMKKLFTDPHFNVMDGLDIYIDDYSQPDPMPAGMLRRMASAQFLKLVSEEVPAHAAQGQTPGQPPQPSARPEVVAQSPQAQTPTHDHPDLQLQPDPAPADPEPGSRAG